MSIRNRTISLRSGPTVPISQAAVAIAAVKIPAVGRIRSISVWAKTVVATAQVGVYSSATNIAGDTAANSTTLVHSAILTLVSDTPQEAVINTDGTQYVGKDEILYVKVTTNGSGTIDNLLVTIIMDY